MWEVEPQIDVCTKIDITDPIRPNPDIMSLLERTRSRTFLAMSSLTLGDTRCRTTREWLTGLREDYTIYASRRHTVLWGCYDRCTFAEIP